MLTSFLLKCRHDIEKRIDLPPTGAFVKNETSGRICYLKDGETKYIMFSKPIEYAEFLKVHRVIDWYSCTHCDQVKMFKYRMINKKVAKGEAPKQKKAPVEIKWKDIKLTIGQLITIIAEHEVSRNNVVQMFVTEVFKAA